MCVSASMCLAEQEFVAVYYQSSSALDDYFESPAYVYGGALGLNARSSIAVALNSALSLNGDDPTFSFFLGRSPGDSFLEFGPIDSS